MGRSALLICLNLAMLCLIQNSSKFKLLPLYGRNFGCYPLNPPFPSKPKHRFNQLAPLPPPPTPFQITEVSQIGRYEVLRLFLLLDWIVYVLITALITNAL